MARIPDEEIERLKKEIPIERLVTGFGVELKRCGANLMGRCPFHDDRNPSLGLIANGKRFRCWACGATGAAGAETSPNNVMPVSGTCDAAAALSSAAQLVMNALVALLGNGDIAAQGGDIFAASLSLDGSADCSTRRSIHSLRSSAASR